MSKEIGALTVAGALDGSEVFHIVQGGNSRQVDLTTVLSLFGLSGAVTARYWRIGGIVSGEAIAELEFRETQGGSELAGTISTTTATGSTANLSDDDLDTFWEATGADNIVIDLGSGNDTTVRGIRIVAPAGADATKAPLTWTLDYSDDGTNWTTASTVDDTGTGAFSDNEERVYDLGSDVASVDTNFAASTFLTLSDTPGSYTANKLLVVNSAGDAVALGFTLPAAIGTEGQVLAVNSGATALEFTDSGSGGTATAARYWRWTGIAPESGTELRMQEFSLQDSSDTTLTGTYSQSGGNIFSGALTNLDNDNFTDGVWFDTIPTTITVDYGSDVTPARVFVRSPESGGQEAKTPSTWTLQSSPDNSTWTTRLVVSGETGWSNQETRTYSIATPSGSAILFTDLLDSPSAYSSGDAGKSAVVNDAEDGVEFKYPLESIIVAVSDETTALTTGTAKVTFRMPYAFALEEVRASVTTAPTGATLNVDINESGVSILSTVLTIDAGEKTSTTAATPAVISDSSLADDAEMTVDIDQIGSTIAGAGLKITLIGRRA